MVAKVKALNPRVFSSNRSFRYSGTDPVKVAGGNAVFRPAGTHADHFLGPEIGGDKRQPAIHAGMARPESRKSAELCPADRLRANPIPSTNAK